MPASSMARAERLGDRAHRPTGGASRRPSWQAASSAAMMPGRPGSSPVGSTSRTWTPWRATGVKLAVARSGAERKTSGSRNGSAILLQAFCRRSRTISRLALRLARSSGLSVEIWRPSWCQVQVPASPVDQPGPALDLDQEEAPRGEDEQVDLVDAAVVGDELEVRPGAVRLVVGQPLADELEGLLLPGELGAGDFLPALGGEAHLSVLCHMLVLPLIRPSDGVYSSGHSLARVGLVLDRRDYARTVGASVRGRRAL